ncbi:MAG: hypothetical protein JW774_10670 [Candidatus Aureabacteria bacterium]|nr:hypothetical protein [Candidatus Auribacterota bacterium]
MSMGNVVDNLISLEKTLSSLYQYFGKTFPDDSAFWMQLSEEETSHANFLKNYIHILPIEFQKMSKDLLTQINDDLKKKIKEYESITPGREDAANFACLTEKSSGEMHYQALLENSSNSERVEVFKTLNFNDKNHATRINEYFSKKNKGITP